MFRRVLSLVGLLAFVGNSSSQVTQLPSKATLAPEFAKLGIAPLAQGERNTCSLFAITAVADFENSRANPAAQQRLSEEFLTWAANDATGLRGDQAMFYEALHGLNSLGICSAELMPYENATDGRRRPSEKSLANAKALSGRWKVEWIKRWDLTRGLNDRELIAIRTALANGHPVACGLRWPKELKGASLLDVPSPAEVFDGHSIVFTGYEDDAKQADVGVLRFRNSSGANWGEDGYGVMSYDYARAYANDALWLQLGTPGSETPIERFEAESLDVLANEKCETSSKRLGRRGGMWSQGRHLLCNAQEGGSTELGFVVRKAGRYRLRVLATAAPDFGTIQITLDGHGVASDFDLYSGRVCPAGSLELGDHDLSAADHRLRVTVVGKNPASSNYCFGLDAVDLLPSGR